MSLTVSTRLGRPSASCSSAVDSSSPPCQEGAASTSSTAVHTSASGASISVLALPPSLPMESLLCSLAGQQPRTASALTQCDEPAEHADVGGPGRPDADRRVVGVEPQPGARQA